MYKVIYYIFAKKEKNGINIHGTCGVVGNYYGMYGIKKSMKKSFRMLRYVNKLFIDFLCAMFN